MNTFHLLIQTPDATLLKEDVSSLRMETEHGELEILPHHAHLIATVQHATPRVMIGTTEHVFAVRNGSVYFDTEKNVCRVLASWGQKREEVTHESLVEYLAFIESKLANNESLNAYQLKYLHDQKQSTDAMLNVSFKKNI
jgi:F0F1-type ATP synthase epsilon subunit